MKDTDYLLDFYKRFLEEFFLSQTSQCIPESPIEKILCAALHIKSSSIFSVMDDREEYKGRVWRMSGCYGEFFDRIVPNFEIIEAKKVKYRLDFALFSTGGMKLAIECDGHDYHERTKQQAKHDKERDRWLQGQGWFVARFTGSEIYKDPFEVVSKIGDIVFSWEDKKYDERRLRGLK